MKNILLLSLLAVTLFIVVTTMGAEPSTDVATLFLRNMQNGNSNALVSLFGENSCHCQPRGGYVAYLRYESGENDNLAFLFGHKFKSGDMSVKSVPTIEKVKSAHLPWEAPESVEIDVPISFDKSEYSPFFLPLDTAYGHPITEKALINFSRDPSSDFSKGMTLRLRPSLKSGVLPAPAKNDPNRKPEYMADLFKEVLTPEQAKYLKPADAAQIIGTDGKNQEADVYAKSFPRLKRGILRLYMGRRGAIQRWAVRKGRFKDPVFELADGKELSLKTPEEALVDIHGPAAPAEEGDGKP